MEHLLKMVESIIKYWRSNTMRKRLSSALAVLVIFITVYSMILPAITLEQRVAADTPGIDTGLQRRAYACAFEAHKHTDSCYKKQPVYDETGKKTGMEKVLVCGKEDYVIHQHDENCYQTVTRTVWENGVGRTVEEQVLVCTLPEIEEHIHSDACYTDGELTCGIPELHTHTIDCCRQRTDPYLQLLFSECGRGL